MKDTSPSVVSGMLLAGKYRVERLLGEGGMGVVVAATNEALRQRVAIKLLRSGALANAKALGRFEREARAAASLRSEHVARVLDVGKLQDGRPYMVMEYLEGRDLGEVIDKGPPVPVAEAIDYVLQACEAIAEAHAAGIIHRDLKPKNLFLGTTVDGRPLVKVLDFGISKMEDAAEDMSLTRTTEIIGSPSYMSPEQLRASKGVDTRTDIWALGVILYELLTKKVPFEACTVTELVAVVLIEPVPDIRARRPDVPPVLAQAVERCLAKRREDRYSSVAELVTAIAPFGSGAHAGMVERVMRVSQGSGRLPPSDTGSNPQVVFPQGSSSGALPTSGRDTAPVVAASGATPIGPGRATPSGIPEARGDAPPPISSARLNIHGGTSVAWGETQVDAPRKFSAAPRSRLPLIGAAAGLFLFLGLAGTAVVYVRRVNATPMPPVTTQPLPSSSIALPDGRKDFPPAPGASGGADPSASVTAEAPSALPMTRVPTSDGRVPSKPGPRPRPGVPSTAGQAGQPTGPAVPGVPPKKSNDDLSDIGRR